MLVTLDQRYARQYSMLTHNKGYSHETRARSHAKVADEYWTSAFEADGSYLFCLHLSLSLFAAGLLIYFFNINRSTFYAVVWLIAIMAGLYTLLTVSPFLIRDFLYDTPFSPPILWAYLGILYVVAQVFSWIKPLHGHSIKTKRYYRDLSNLFRAGIVKGNAKSVEEAASKPSSKIDAKVLERILLVLDDDHALETFFNALPGFCGSKLVRPLYSRVTTKLQQSLDGFLDRTFSSHLVPESIRNDRLHHLPQCSPFGTRTHWSFAGPWQLSSVDTGMKPRNPLNWGIPSFAGAIASTIRLTQLYEG